MAEPNDLLRETYGAPATQTGTSGGWDAPAASDWSMLSRFRKEGERLATEPVAKQASEADIMGPIIKAYGDARGGDYGWAALHGLQGLLEASGATRAGSGVAKGAQAAAHLLNEGSLPERVMQHDIIRRALAQKSIEAGVPMAGRNGKPLKVGGDAWKRAIARDVEKRFPAPTAAPPAALASEAADVGRPAADVVAHHMAMNNPTPWQQGAAGAGLLAAPFAPQAGQAADEAMGGPFAAQDRTERDYREPDKAYRLDDPHIKRIHDDLTRANAVLAGHVGAGAAMAAATPPLARMGWRGAGHVMGPFVGLGADVAGINPLAGLALMGIGLAPALLPFAPAAGTAFGAGKMAVDSGPLRERALTLKDILDAYGRRGEDRFGPDAQASAPREGHAGGGSVSPPNQQLAMNTTPIPGYPSEPELPTPELLHQREKAMEFLRTLPGHRDGIVDPLQRYDWFSHREPETRDLMMRRERWLEQQRPYPGYPAYGK